MAPPAKGACEAYRGGRRAWVVVSGLGKETSWWSGWPEGESSIFHSNSQEGPSDKN